jgi:hypothetical protein
MMDMLFWFWLVPGVVIFLMLFMLVLWASMANAQSGEPGWGLLAFVIGTPAVAALAAIWPIWFPVAFVLDLRDDVRKKRKNAVGSGNVFKA